VQTPLHDSADYYFSTLSSIIDITKFSLPKITKKNIFLNKFHGNPQQPPPLLGQLTVVFGIIHVKYIMTLKISRHEMIRSKRPLPLGLLETARSAVFSLILEKPSRQYESA
jgi:hypothetical protein